MGNGLVFSSKAIVVVFLLPAFACAVLADRQQQIIAHKEQKQASKRAEYDLQHGVSQSMAKSAAVRSLGGFYFA